MSVLCPIQITLRSHVQKDILRDLGTPDKLRKSLDVVEIVLGFLSSGGGKPKTRLLSYLKKLRIECKSFSEKVNNLQDFDFVEYISPFVGKGALQPGAHPVTVADTVCWSSRVHHSEWSGMYVVLYP